MTDYFKTIRAYMRGKWGLRSVPDPRWNISAPYMSGEKIAAHFDSMGRSEYVGRELMRLYGEIRIARRNKKKHSHLQKQLDDLLNGGADISDQQTETTQ